MKGLRHAWWLALLLAACSGPAPVESYDRDRARRGAEAAVSEPGASGITLELGALPDGTQPGSLVVALEPPRLEGVAPPVLGWLEVVDPGAGTARPLAPLASLPPQATLQRVDGSEAIAAVPDKTVAVVLDSAAGIVLSRGSLDLVAVGDRYALGDVALAASDWALFEVTAVTNDDATARLVAGDRLPRRGDRLVWSGTSLPGDRTVRVALSASAEAQREVRFELDRAGLAGGRLELVPLLADAAGGCQSGRALAARAEAAGVFADEVTASGLAAELVPLGADRVAVGWTRMPLDAALVSLPDVFGGCLETSPQGARIVLRLAVLEATHRWHESWLHASSLAGTALPEGVGLVVALYQARALLELGDPSRADEVLETALERHGALLPEAGRAALGLYRAQLAFELGALEVASQRLDAVSVAALSPELEPARALLATSLALVRDRDAALAVLDASPARDHAVLVAWRSLLEALGAERGEVLEMVHEIDGAGGAALAAWPGASAALLELAAQLALSRGQLAQAATLLDEARLRYHLAGEPFRAGVTQLKLAQMLSAQGFALDGAEVSMIAATDLAQAGALRDAAQVLLGSVALLEAALAAADTSEEARKRALELLGEALRVSRVLYTHANDVAGVARAWSQLGEVLARHFGDAHGASEAFEAALFYALRAGDLGRAAQAELAIALALRSSEASDEAIAERLASARRLAEAAGEKTLLDAIAAIESPR